MLEDSGAAMHMAGAIARLRIDEGFGAWGKPPASSLVEYDVRSDGKAVIDESVLNLILKEIGYRQMHTFPTRKTF